MNLEKLNVVELDAQSKSGLNGGGDSWMSDAWEILKEVDEGWDEFKDRLQDGWDSYGECSC